MPTIHFRKGNKPPLTVKPGANLMQVLLENGVPVASSCGGDGVCAKCRIEIVDGQANLSPQNDMELFLRERHRISKEERVSCQTTVLGDITIDTSYW